MHIFRTALCALVLLPACAATPRAPSERAAVLATVQAFFDAMHARDPQAAALTVVPDGVFVNTRIEDGKRVEKHFSNREWIEKLSKEKSVLLEQITGTPTVLIEGDLASVWCSYRFSIDQKPSHTGFDVFNLVRTAQGWRISGGAYSVVRATGSPQ
jgi:ketosteroid isomerase-like protein